MARRSDRVLVLIGVFKLVKVAALVLVAVGAFSHGVQRWLAEVQPGRRHAQEVIARITHTSPHRLHLIGAATIVYAALFLTEGLGLVFCKVWAEYATTVITASFVPLEVYDLLERGTWMKATLIALNVAVVVYLVLRLRRDRRWPFRPHAAAMSVD